MGARRSKARKKKQKQQKKTAVEWTPVTELPLDEALTVAVSMHRQSMLIEARDMYLQIVQRFPGHLDAMHFLGVALHQLGDTERGLELIQEVVDRLPEHVDARSNLGNLLKDLGRMEEAEQAFRTVIDARPDHANAHCNLGVVLKNLGRLDDAEEHLRRAIELHEDHPEAQHNLATVLFRQGRHDEAAKVAERAVELAPTGQAQETLVRALRQAGRFDEALVVARRWIAAHPDDPVARHMLAALSQDEVPERAADDYVAKVFDEFAPSFDTVLQTLEYRAPELVAGALRRRVGEDGDRDVLDAGCGTGLCGPLLRPSARRLVGIDLSAGMVRRAEQRESYDEVAVAELTAYLADREAAFDVVVSADTLCYFGPLDAVSAAAAKALRPGGWLLFTVERAPEDVADFRLEHTGRYSHSGDYVSRQLAAAGFGELDLEEQVLRQELGKPVQGILVSARKLGDGTDSVSS